MTKSLFVLLLFVVAFRVFQIADDKGIEPEKTVVFDPIANALPIPTPYPGELLVVVHSDSEGWGSMSQDDPGGRYRNVTVRGGRRFFVNIRGTAWPLYHYDNFPYPEKPDGTCIEWIAERERYKEVTCNAL